MLVRKRRSEFLARNNAFEDADGSIITNDGKILMFSVTRFKKDIVEGDCCFICGVQRVNKPFNDEHILPRWILERQSLFDRNITLPNLSGFKYGSYVIPCCKDCNELMGKTFENPISQLFSGGHAAVASHVQAVGSRLIFNWLALIFLKTHLKDKSLRTTLDSRKGDTSKIADGYDFAEMHHIHCIARTFYTGATWLPPILGSLMVLPAKKRDHFEDYDFVDLYYPQSILLRVGDVALVAVLNDACAALSKFHDKFMKIRGALSPLQLREILSHLSYINLKLKERPQFFSSFLKEYGYSITTSHPKLVELTDYDARMLGEIMSGLCLGMISSHPDREGVERHIKAGEWSFLFDKNGKFQPNSMDIVENTEEKLGDDR